jgi:hypothetical protein
VLPEERNTLFNLKFTGAGVGDLSKYSILSPPLAGDLIEAGPASENNLPVFMCHCCPGLTDAWWCLEFSFYWKIKRRREKRLFTHYNPD